MNPIEIKTIVALLKRFEHIATIQIHCSSGNDLNNPASCIDLDVLDRVQGTWSHREDGHVVYAINFPECMKSFTLIDPTFQDMVNFFRGILDDPRLLLV